MKKMVIITIAFLVLYSCKNKEEETLGKDEKKITTEKIEDLKPEELAKIISENNSNLDFRP